MIKVDLTDTYLEYIKTKDDKYFTLLYNALRSILFSRYGGNELFESITNTDELVDFDDIFQQTMIRLYTKSHMYDVKKGKLLSYAQQIFKNLLIDKIRKIKIIKVPINFKVD